MARKTRTKTARPARTAPAQVAHQVKPAAPVGNYILTCRDGVEHGRHATLKAAQSVALTKRLAVGACIQTARGEPMQWHLSKYQEMPGASVGLKWIMAAPVAVA